MKPRRKTKGYGAPYSGSLQKTTARTRVSWRTSAACSVQALKEHRDFAVGLMEAVRKHLQWHFTTSENENTALKQKISGFEEKDEQREREVKLMTRNLQDAHKQLSQTVESRLRDSQKGSTTIGDAEKCWLKEDINVVRRTIEPYTELEGWADDDPLGFLPWNDRYLDFSDVSMKLVER